MSWPRIAIALSIICLTTACAESTIPGDDPAASGEDSTSTSTPEFQNGLEQLKSQYDDGGGKRDYVGLSDPCKILESNFSSPLLSQNMGIFFEVQGEGNVTVAQSAFGINGVADFTHQQLAVFQSGGFGARAAGLGGGYSADLIAGFAFGFDDSVLDWEGKMVAATGNASLPILSSFLSGSAGAFFQPGSDLNGDGKIDFTSEEVREVPDSNVYGLFGGVELGLRLDAWRTMTGFDGELEATQRGLAKEATGKLFRNLKDNGGLFIGGLDVSLVTRDGTTCSPEWPAKDGDKDCIISVGSASDSRSDQSLEMAKAVCSMLGECAHPLAWAGATTAYAVGLLHGMARGPSICSPDDNE